MLEDPLVDVLLAAVAVAMLVLALEVHSLKHFHVPPGQALASEAPKEEPKRKLSPTETYLKQFDPKESVAKPEEKPISEETRTTLAVEPPPALPHGKSEPFNPEALANE